MPAQGAAANYKDPPGCADIPAGQALGRSRGGLTIKIHLAADGRGLPLSVLLTGGQPHDNRQLLPLLDSVAVPRRGPGRPRTRPRHLIADKAYSHPSTRAALRARQIPHTTPERTDQQARWTRRGPSWRPSPGL